MVGLDLVKNLLLIVTTLYQAIACWHEDQTSPPGQRIDIGGYKLHLYTAGDSTSQPTIVLDHSLGGIEGYFLLPELAKLGRVCCYDRAGYGWSDRSPHPRNSQQIVTELDQLLTAANVAPPYLLIGNSFGSYNLRLYAYQFPEKVVGLVLTDGLHENGMLQMTLLLRALKLFFISGFVMCLLGAGLGIIRLLKICGVFELIKPPLRQYPSSTLNRVKRSFCRPKHWITMAQEMWSLDTSGRQLQAVESLGSLPIVSIKANSFFKPSLWTRFIPLEAANRLRDEMHQELLKLSTDCTQLQAETSGHFVWLDQPEVMIQAVKILLEKAN
ncbi:alpha/beta hydrolase [Phormidium sp. CLA17]|uniref:alpha/beta hydrolase n=1 Tax=Leptolyngbya sp. Cla-17 TaxID=2803751 RepID=UPI00149093B4|nr:alpha/beta hydrolase [Leptolyngbya sp. Cla-17]MBM0743369.1 alpha/beta hydrolase [Leptolyngbya sp. Cla-17]